MTYIADAYSDIAKRKKEIEQEEKAAEAGVAHKLPEQSIFVGGALLDLVAKGLGIRRYYLESDESLRRRMVQVLPINFVASGFPFTVVYTSSPDTWNPNKC